MFKNKFSQLSLLLVLSFIFAFSIETALAANPYSGNGITDYQYTTGLYNLQRLKKNSDCMKPFYDAYQQGKITNYTPQQEKCFLDSFDVILKSQPAVSGDSCVTKCMADNYQYAPENQRGAFCNYDCAHGTTGGDALNDAGKKYQDRYVAKCMDAYKNNPSVSSCCSALAAEDTKAQQKKGVFDTATTAEIPIIVDENKCKPTEYKYSCSDLYKQADKIGGKANACESYINKCIEAGKFAYESEQGRISSCELDYAMNRPVKLITMEKYVNICLKNGAKNGEDAASLGSSCLSDYTYAAREYINRCVTTMNGVNYNPISSFIIRLRGLINSTPYNAQVKQCLGKYDQALDKMLAN